MEWVLADLDRTQADWCDDFTGVSTLSGSWVESSLAYHGDLLHPATHMKRLLLSFVVAFGTTCAGAESLSVSDGWIRAAPPVAQVRAGYLVIENASAADIVLTKVESPDFGAIEIHTMYDDAGIMRMRRVPELHVPANGKVELKPGGLHLMMFRPQRALAEGDQVDVVLSGDAGAVATTLVVKAATP